ncbi:MAG: PAS domain-containing sensor histidine kinase [Bacteroidota bacterium]
MNTGLEKRTKEELLAEIERLRSVIEAFPEHLREREAVEISYRTMMSVIEQSPASIVITDLNGSIEYVNPKFTEISGYTLQEALGQNPRLLKTGHTSSEQYSELWNTITSGNTWKGEFLNRRKNGEEYWERATIAPIRTSDGEITRFIGVKEDITEQMIAKAALRHSEQNYRDLVENLNEGIWVIDKNSITTFVNSRMAGMLEFTKEEMIGRSLFDFIEKEAFVSTAKAVERRKNGSKEHHEAVILTKLKKQLIISVETYPVFSSLGEYAGAVAAISDVTEQKRASEAVEASRDQLRQLATRVEQIREEERTSIAREIHDELGQNLTGLKMNLSWLAKKLVNEQTLHDKVLHMSDLVDVTIDEVRRIATELRPGVLDELGLGAAMVWHGKKFEQESGISCTVEIHPSVSVVPQQFATAMFRIFQESLTNVARHSRALSVFTKLSIEEKILKMEVNDDGIGIEESKLNDRHSIGLLGMKERAIALDGCMFISSQNGSGTKITTMIPMREK